MGFHGFAPLRTSTPTSAISSPTCRRRRGGGGGRDPFASPAGPARCADPTSGSRSRSILKRPRTHQDGATSGSRSRTAISGPRGDVSIRLRPGAHDGQVLRFRGRGNEAPVPGGQHGNIYVTLAVESHPELERDGLDIRVGWRCVLTAALAARWKCKHCAAAPAHHPPGTRAGGSSALGSGHRPPTGQRRSPGRVMSPCPPTDPRERELLKELESAPEPASLAPTRCPRYRAR